MAKIQHRNSNQRTILHEVLPIDTPIVVGIYTGDICNFHCKYCVRSERENSLVAKDLVHSFLDVKTAQLIGKQLLDFPEKIKLVMFSSLGEPTLNPDLPQIIKTLCDLDVADGYEMVTNASVLTPTLSKQLIDAGLTRLVVSIQGVTAETYKDICGYDLNVDELKSNLQYFYAYGRSKCKLHIKTVDMALNKEKDEEKHFYEMFESICDTIYVDHVVDLHRDIDSKQKTTNIDQDSINIAGMRIENKSKKYHCTSIFYSMFILANGDVVPCCNPPYPIKYGNIQTDALTELWNSKIRINFLKSHLKNNGIKNFICQSCREPQVVQRYKEDDIAGYEEIILDRMKVKYGF